MSFVQGGTYYNPTWISSHEFDYETDDGRWYIYRLPITFGVTQAHRWVVGLKKVDGTLGIGDVLFRSYHACQEYVFAGYFEWHLIHRNFWNEY